MKNQDPRKWYTVLIMWTPCKRERKHVMARSHIAARDYALNKWSGVTVLLVKEEDQC